MDAGSEARFPAVEALCESYGSRALHTSNPGHRPEQVGREPWLGRLRREVFHEQSDLAIESGGGKRGEEIGRSEVAVIFRDLVLEDQLVTPGVPGELRYEAVVLVPIVAIVSEDEVRGELLFQRLELVFYRGA